MSDPNKPTLNINALKGKLGSEPSKSEPELEDIFESGLDISAFAELTPEEMEALKKEAAEQVLAEMRAARKKAFLKQQVQKYRQAGKPGQEMIPLTIDLPGHADRVSLDGTVFFHGVTYTVPMDKFRTIIDICARAWEHENEVGGANRDAYKGRAPVNKVIRPGDTGGDQSRIGPIVKM